jgi:hypothetical protein
VDEYKKYNFKKEKEKTNFKEGDWGLFRRPSYMRQPEEVSRQTVH